MPAARDTPKKPRACIPCHDRKVKCNAEETGLPCQRCAQNGRVDACELVPRPARTGGRPKKRLRLRDEAGDSLQPPQLEVPQLNSSDLLSLSRSSARRESTSLLSASVSGSAHPDHVRSHWGNRVVEEDSQLETALQLAQNAATGDQVSSRASTPDAQEVYTYHAGIDSATILGHVLNPDSPSKLVRIRMRSPRKDQDESESRSDTKSMAYLHDIGALDVHQPPTCKRLVHLYFERVHPYVPVLHRLAFMRKLAKGNSSTFILQCIFTSVAPYMSTDLLVETGYSDRVKAQKSSFNKAQALYDTANGISQLHRLQGSLILTSTYFAFGLDKDCRFWLHNAVRIALQVGIHRKQILSQLNEQAARLFKRMFWILNSRDIIMVIAGRLNVRALDQRYCDVPPLAEEDWESESAEELRFHGLTPVPVLHKLYLVHHSRLDRICARYIELFKRPGALASPAACEDLDDQIFQWRQSLPRELQPETVNSWSSENVWILVLRALVCRLQCLLYKNIRLLATSTQEDCKRRALAKQRNAMLEMDSTIRSILLNDLVEFCPFSIATCTSTLVAMHFECVVSRTCTDAQRQIHLAGIQSGIAYLRQSSEYWNSVKWSLRMFDSVATKLNLPIEPSSGLKGGLLPGTIIVQSSGEQLATAHEKTSGASGATDGNQDDRNPVPTRAPTLPHSSLSGIDLGHLEDQFPLDFEISGDVGDFPIEKLFDLDTIQTWTYEDLDY